MILAGLCATVLAGCVGGTDDAPESDDAGVEEPAAQAPGDHEAGAAVGPADRDARISQASLAAERRQITTAGLVVETDEVLLAARQAESIAVGAGGFVTDEDTHVQGDERLASGEDDAAVTLSSLTIRVPPDAVDEVLTSLAGLGTLVSQTRATTDVTDEYVDVEARLDSQRASLDRLLQLVGQAGELDDVIALENEIARRQADLDSLAGRLQALDDRTDLATIALTLTSAADQTAAEPRSGFLGGLEQGWDAFTGSAVAVLMVVGALLPFAALLAVAAAPLMIIRRRRGLRTGPGGEPTSAPAPTAGG